MHGKAQPMIKVISDKGWYILNGAWKRDEEGELTYVGCRGNSVIGYVLMDTKVIDQVKKFKIGDRIESNHLPIKLKLEVGESVKVKKILRKV